MLIITAAVKTYRELHKFGEKKDFVRRAGTGYANKTSLLMAPCKQSYFTSIPDIATLWKVSPFLFKGTVFSTGGYLCFLSATAFIFSVWIL
jgi:hypothetical protein